MQVATQGKSTYQITLSGLSYTLSIFRASKYLTIQIKSSSSSLTYQSIFTLENLFDISKRFRGFDSIEEILEDIQYIIQTKDFKISKEKNNQVIFSYFLGKEQINLPIGSNDNKQKYPLDEDEKIENLKHDLKSFFDKVSVYIKTESDTSKSEKFFNKVTEVIKTVSDAQIQRLKETLKAIKDYRLKELDKEKEKKALSVLEGANTFIKDEESLLKIKGIKTDSDFSSPVNALCILPDGRFASGSSDCKINVFNSTTYQCEMTITGHEDDVLYLSLLSDGNLISSSSDNTIKIWKISNFDFTCVATLTGHKDKVLKSIQLSKGRIGSCSKDQTLKIWKDSPPYNCIENLTGHEDDVMCFLELQNNAYLVSVGYCLNDNTVRFWGNESYKCEKKIEGIWSNWNEGMIEVRGKIIIGGWSEVSVIDCEKKEVEKRIYISDAGDIYSLIDLGGELILCGNFDGEIFIVDTRMMEVSEMEKKKVHGASVRGLLMLDQKTLVTCSEECCIKIWK